MRASDACIPPRPSPPDEEQAEIERLHTRQGEFTELDDDEWTAELAEEAEGIDTRLAEIDEAVKARAVFKPEDIAIAGLHRHGRQRRRAPGRARAW